jgi:apolipoprotein N-acyltransferase
LVILPENEFPPLNDEARAALSRSPVGPFLEGTYQKLLTIAHTHHAALLVGGSAVTGWRTQGSEHVGSEIHNSVYFFDPQAEPAVSRYDKIRLVPFSERLPFANGPGWLSQIALSLAASRAAQPLQAGTLNDFRPFQLSWSGPAGQSQTKFIAPVCLENIDPVLIAEMMRDPTTRFKQAEFIANLSNDGWFNNQEKYQHLQLLVWRCIENRVPMARSSNTGISAFIDSTGRVEQTVPVDTNGFVARRINLDSRITFYTRHGDVFAMTCLALVGIAVTIQLVSAVRRSSPTHS